MRQARSWLLLVSSVSVALFAAHVVATHEESLDADNAAARRLTVEELLPQASLTFALGEHVDAIRVVAYAFKRGGAPSATSATLRFTQAGSELELAGDSATKRQRPSSEVTSDGDLGVGVKLAWNVEIKHETPRVSLALTQLSGADGLLIRCYGRETFDGARARALGREQGLALAKKLDEEWIDLDRHARAALSTTRWTRLAALSDATQAPVAHLLTERRLEVFTLPVAQHDPEAFLEPLDPTLLADFFASSAQHPLVVEAGAVPLLIRLLARVPLQPAEATRSIALEARIDRASGEHDTIPLSAELTPSLSDRFWDPISASFSQPASAPARFYLMVPAHGRLSVWPEQGVVALSLAELDPLAAPKRSAKEGAARSADVWRGWVPRRPSNWGMFASDSHGSLRVAAQRETLPTSARLYPALERAQVNRPRGPRRPGKPGFVKASPLSVLVGPHGSVLNLRFAAASKVDVTIRVDDGSPRRRRDGRAEHVTLTRAVSVEGETAFSLLLGDDLEPGIHRVSFVTSPAEPLWLHAPWAHRAHRLATSAWIAGDFEP
jgi:hypothetical protein